MNIFKILASGDGSINEPNVSAFLGYLLNPKADHGINDELLKKVLQNLDDKNPNYPNGLEFLVDDYDNRSIKNLSQSSKYEIVVLLEQAFNKEGDKGKMDGETHIVDIVILCFKKKPLHVETLARKIISKSDEPDLEQIFLIENKINDDSTTEGQLSNQITATIATLKDILPLKTEEEIKQLLSIIYVTPVGKKSDVEFSNFINQYPKDKISSSHLFWTHGKKDKNEYEVINDDNMISFLKNILQDDAEGEIEPINENTKSIVKAFIDFVQSGFQSTIEEERDGKKNIVDTYESLEDLKQNYPDLLNVESWALSESFNNYIRDLNKNLCCQYSQNHCVSVNINSVKKGNKIFSLSRAPGKGLRIELIDQNFEIPDNEKQNQEKEIKKLGLEVLQREYKPKIREVPRSINLNIDNIKAIFYEHYEIIKKNNNIK